MASSNGGAANKEGGGAGKAAKGTSKHHHHHHHHHRGGGGGGGGGDRTTTAAATRLAEQYPVNTLWEMTLSNQTDKVSGRVYCTDDFSQSIVLQKPLVHTTLASEVHIVHVPNIVRAVRLPDDDDRSDQQRQNNTNYNQRQQQSAGTPLSTPLPKIQKKTLEERERKALRQAEESFKHINQKASPKGQACFDRLLKACNEVAWKDQSIIVLNQVQVDPPYTADTCKIVVQNRGPNYKKSLEDASLDRVKKIVAACDTAVS